MPFRVFASEPPAGTGARWLAPAVALSVLVHGLALAFVLEAGPRRAALLAQPEPIAVSLLAAGEDRPGLAVGPPPPASPPPAATTVRPPPPPAAPTPSRRRPPRLASAPAAPGPVAETMPAGPLAAPAEGAPQPSREVATLDPSAHPGTAATVRRVFGEGEVDGVASPRQRVRPDYPRRARVLGREADVGLEVLVEADGSVSGVALLASGGDAFDRAALEAVGRERWRPARLAGAAVPSRVRFTVRFRLDD